MVEEPSVPIRRDVLVIGGGQAGLAMGYCLQRAGLDFVILDAGSAVGHVWRSRWDSLNLFTPAQYAALPGMAFPAPVDTYAGRDEVAGYLATYAERFGLPIKLNARVTGLRRAGAAFKADSPAGTFQARQVVVATGPFSTPYVPPVADGLAPEVPQIHTAAYRNPEQVPSGRVLVVGGANSGFQIAAELAQAGRTVDLAEGRRNACIPQRPLGRDVFWWQDKLGLLRVSAQSRLGRLMAANDGTVIGSTRPGLRRLGVTFRPRVTSTAGRSVTFADGSRSDVDAVVWATGFRIDDTWIRIPQALDDRGRLLQHRGVVDAVPGLFTIGRPWQHTTGSALLGFVQHDASWLAQQTSARTAAA
ncbi:MULTISPECIES: flavin-containing monooxygenase [Kribbella]|uniref:NAD(P)/FAD-dependent oxidoreductase n=1 Tax=Kribbella sancticallisti TaxID=460087 RepID=A0ABP4QCC9_9ACTN|nr:NAD(P)/FAD-dependent oxidoreductase [Kribbella catacumbae]